LATADLREVEADEDTIWPEGVPWPRRTEALRMAVWR
jgi:hypothetical protein